MKKLISLILILTMLLTMLAACKNDKEEPVETEPPETEEPSYLDQLPELNLQEREYKILISSQHTDFYDQENETGDFVDNACFLRNAEIEERYKVEFVYTAMDGNSSGSSAFAAAITNSVMQSANEGFNIVIGQNYYCLPLVTTGSYHNLRESEVIDFDAEWSHKAINDNGTINGKLYGASGAYVISQLTHAMAIFYNKNIFNDYGFAEEYDIYQIVRDGKWTWDLFYTMVTAFDSVDVNDPSAIFGFNYYYHAMIGLHTGMGNNPIVKNDEGEYTLDNYYNDRLESIYSRLRDFFNDHPAVVKDDLLTEVSGGNANRMDHILFMMNYVHALVDAPALQKAEGRAIGVLPAPKYDENQKDYHTRIMRGDLYYIPKNVDLEVAAVLVEALNYGTYKMVYPEYWDKLLELRSADTSEDREMIRILSATVYSSFAEYYTQDLEGIHQAVALQTEKNASSMSTWWGNNEKMVRKKLTKMLEIYG